MFAPGSQPEGDLVKNKNAKPITFVKNKGRLSLRMGNKKVGGAKMVNERLAEMKAEIKQAEAGRAVTTMKDTGPGSPEFKRYGIKSTFPTWFRQEGYSSKKDFLKVINSRKGKRYERLVKRAIGDLSNGYSSSFGRVPANDDFLVKSRQRFNNKGVTFRYIDGKVRPMRFGGRPRLEEAPF
jgi:hypothetical protein